MLRLFYLFAACTCAFSAFGQSSVLSQKLIKAKPIEVSINANVELLGFVYFLGYEGRQSETDPTYTEKKKARYAYGIDLYHRYKRFENSENLSVIIGFAENIWLDYFIALILQLDDFPNARLNNSIPLSYYVRFSSKRDSAEAWKNADAFITAMNQLYKEVDFGNYFKQRKPFYDNAISQVKTGLPDARFIPEMEAFYQGHFDTYSLIPSLTIPASMGFGIKYNKMQKTNAVHVFGAFAPPALSDVSKPDMGFQDKKYLLELSTHEFGHSFVNPAVDKLPDTLIKKTEKLFLPIKDAMSDQAYTQWKSCVYEHFVRAGEVVIAKNLGSHADSERLKKYYVEGRKFIYLPTILAELEKYNTRKDVPYAQVVLRVMQELAKQ